MVKTSLRSQLKQTNLENRFHISTESLKEGFIDTVFQHFVDKLKYYFGYANRRTTTGASVFMFLFNIFGCYVTF